MFPKSTSKMNLKVLLSYVVLAALGLTVAFLLFSEFKTLIPDGPTDLDGRLLLTNGLLTQLYEAESLSKIALQKGNGPGFEAYREKIDSVSVRLDSLTKLAPTRSHKQQLDTVRMLLAQKVVNIEELLRLKTAGQRLGNSMESVLKEIKQVEASVGRLTVEDFEKNPERLSPKERTVLENWVSYLNKNVPGQQDPEKLDSIIRVSKAILLKAQQKTAVAERSLQQKEIQINRTDLQLSGRLHKIISGLEIEAMASTYQGNLEKREALDRGVWLAIFAAIAGLLIAGIFAMLINRDFWKIESYREKLEKEKKYSESLLKNREQLMQTVSHDLRTPLGTISGYSEILEESGLNPREQKYVGLIKSASKYVNDLVNDLLDFSRLEGGMIIPEPRRFTLHDLILEAGNSFKGQYPQKPIELLFNIDPNLRAPITADALRIRQILNNLLGNAFKFTETGTIKISARLRPAGRSHTWIHISVQDTGIGIKKEQLQAIFNEFSQADHSIERKYGGYGLGLTISKKMAELLGGRLNVASEPRKGSTFTVELPIVLTGDMDHRPKNAIRESDRPLSLAIIDDDPSIREMLGEFCRRSTIRASLFSGLVEFSRAKDPHFDVLLTDIQMPENDGFKVLEALKSGSIPHYSGQPVIAMTGQRNIDRERFANAGFYKVLEKPFSKKMFLAILKTAAPDAKIKDPVMGEFDSASDFGLFCLDTLISFLGDSPTAISEVLQKFLEETQINLGRLQNHKEMSNSKGINDIAHKMLPMFRQLQVHDSLPLLEKLEAMDKFDPKELRRNLVQLSGQVTALDLAIRAYLSKDPCYIG